MDFNDEGRKLLTLKIEYETKEHEYLVQRDIVYSELANQSPHQIEVGGFRIARQDDYVQMRFDKDLLIQELRNNGLSEDIISRIMGRSKDEIQVTGSIKFTKL